MTTEFPPAFTKSTVKIPSATLGWHLDAWKYLPTQHHASKQHPVILMAHGFSANKLMGLSEYAEVFSAAGYACVVFDYRRWGASDGMPRHCIYVSEQLQDYRTAAKWARQQPEFDAQRVVLWGTSFSGGHVLTLASDTSLNVAAAVGQCPYVRATSSRAGWAMVKLLALAVADLLKQALSLTPVYVPAGAQPGEVGVLTAPGSVEGMLSILKDKRNEWPNQVSASSIFEIPFYRPDAAAHQIQCPLLLVVPKQDNICVPKATLDVVKRATKGEAFVIDGGHFDIYPPNKAHEKALEVQLEFLKKHVPAS